MWINDAIIKWSDVIVRLVVIMPSVFMQWTLNKRPCPQWSTIPPLPKVESLLDGTWLAFLLPSSATFSPLSLRSVARQTTRSSELDIPGRASFTMFLNALIPPFPRQQIYVTVVSSDCVTREKPERVTHIGLQRSIYAILRDSDTITPTGFCLRKMLRQRDLFRQVQ